MRKNAKNLGREVEFQEVEKKREKREKGMEEGKRKGERKGGIDKRKIEKKERDNERKIEKRGEKVVHAKSCFSAPSNRIQIQF